MKPLTRCVLVVDDDEAVLAAVQDALGFEGYDVLQGRHGAEALALLGSRRVDMILLDLRMPVMHGWAFAEAYRALPGPQAPLVVFSAATEVDRWARQVGADAWLPKPFELDDLLALVEKLCDPPPRANPGDSSPDCSSPLAHG